MRRRGFLQAVGAMGTSSAVFGQDTRGADTGGRKLKLDLHTHYYP
jgi:hypothetical protein